MLGGTGMSDREYACKLKLAKLRTLRRHRSAVVTRLNFSTMVIQHMPDLGGRRSPRANVNGGLTEIPNARLAYYVGLAELR